MSGVLVFNILFAFLFIVIVAMQFLLQKSLKRSLYYYRNVAFIGGILFGFVLLLSLYSYLITCLMRAKSPTIRFLFLEFVNFPRRFSMLALPVFVIICMLIIASNISLIRHEGFRVKNVLGVLMTIIVVGGTLLIYLIADYVGTYITLFLLLGLCYFECFFVGTLIMGYLAAKQAPVFDKDFVIILGCSIDKRGGLLPLIKGRTNRAIRFAWDQEVATGKPVYYVPSGGQGGDEIMSEGSAMELYLLTHGAELNEVYAERESKNTYENFLFSKKIIDDIKPDARVCFATTNYHMFRSGILARQVGLNAEGIASDTKWYFWPNGFIREFFGIVLMKKKAHLCVIVALGVMCLLLYGIDVFLL